MAEERGPEKEPLDQETEKFQELRRELSDLEARVHSGKERKAELKRKGATPEDFDSLDEELDRVGAELQVFKETLERHTQIEERRLQAKKEIAELGLRSAREAALEGLKLEFEAHKNVTFLGSGALVAYAVVTANLFPGPDALGQLGLAYALMVVSLVATSVMMFYIASLLGTVLSPESAAVSRWRTIAIRVVDALALGSFFSSLIFFVQFFMANLN